jgi:hypothetical protein
MVSIYATKKIAGCQAPPPSELRLGLKSGLSQVTRITDLFILPKGDLSCLEAS